MGLHADRTRACYRTYCTRDLRRHASTTLIRKRCVLRLLRLRPAHAWRRSGFLFGPFP